MLTCNGVNIICYQIVTRKACKFKLGFMKINTFWTINNNGFIVQCLVRGTNILYELTVMSEKAAHILLYGQRLYLYN